MITIRNIDCKGRIIPDISKVAINLADYPAAAAEMRQILKAKEMKKGKKIA